MRRECAANLAARVRIAMADSLCHWLFWDNFESFHRQFPDIFLKIITFASTEEMFRMLNQNEVDAVYTLRQAHISLKIHHSFRKTDKRTLHSSCGKPPLPPKIAHTFRASQTAIYTYRTRYQLPQTS